MAPATQERQIKPIYDAIDSGQYKAAFQGCVKLLKKQPKNDLAKALKAVALIRMNKPDEGNTICDELLATNPSDELVMGAMSLVLKYLNRHDDMATMFEAAYKKFPTNDEFGAQAFMAYIRLGNWKAAQQIASKLNKNSKDERFLYWNIMCLFLQANEVTTPAQTQPILYKLALRLISTCQIPSTVTPERFFLHLSILRELGDLDQALQLLDTDLARSLCETNLNLEDLRHSICIAAGRKVEEYNLAKTRLIEKRDRNWLTFLKFINSAVARMDEPDILPETRTTLSHLAEIDGSSERGSLLARLELETKIRAEFPDVSKPDFVHLLKLHFDTFNAKPSCFEDLKKFSILMEEEERAQWRAFLDGQDVAGTPATVTKLNHQINTFKLQRWDINAEEVSVELEELLAQKYLKAYIAALPLGRDLPKTELQPADDLALLAASSLISLSLLTRSQSYLSSAVTLLEFAVIRSPQDFQFRLLLIRLYRLIGAPSLALEHYRKLGVKQVQTDTMVHYIMSRCGTFNLSAMGDLTYLQECLESSNIYTLNTNETPDMVIKAFQFEKYSQLTEFIEFEDRLDSSIQRDLTKMEHVRMRLAHEPASAELVDTELVELKFLFERNGTQFDNRDFSILPELQPHGQSIDIQTAMGGNSPGFGWLHSWMKMYILVFQLASDLDPAIDGRILFGEKFSQVVPQGQAPLDERIREFSENEAKELTEDESRMRDFVMKLILWLEPHNEYSRPPYKSLPDSSAASILANITSSTVNPPSSKLLSNGSQANNGQTATPPSLVELPPEVSAYFQTVESSFNAALKDEQRWKSLHIASLTQEAFIIFNFVTARFRLGGGAKIKKGDPLLHTLKSLREQANATLKSMAHQLIKIGESDATAEGRRAFVDETKLVRCVSEIDHDFCLDVAKKVTDARRKVREGFGRGIERICKAQGQGVSLSS